MYSDNKKNNNRMIAKLFATMVLVIFTCKVWGVTTPTPTETIPSPDTVTADIAKPKPAQEHITGPRINSILISDEADANGYVEREHLPINKNKSDIYITVEIKNGIPDTVVTVTLIGPNIKPQSATSTTTKTGNLLKAFSFDNKYPWQVGEYQVTTTLSNGDMKTVKFNVSE